MKQATLVISLIALVGVMVLFLQLSGIDATPRTYAPLAPAAQERDDHHQEEEIEVAIAMGHIQRFHQKFWLAMRAGNGDLAQFYLHEMEEAMEEIAEAGIVDDGVELSQHMRTYGLAVNEHLQEKLRNEGVGSIQAEAELLVNACNSCHKASGYEMINIRVPVDFDIPDQDMRPLQQ